MRILQLNLNHCEAAQTLLFDTISKLRIDVAILCLATKKPKQKEQTRRKNRVNDVPSSSPATGTPETVMRDPSASDINNNDVNKWQKSAKQQLQQMHIVHGHTVPDDSH
ncbi:hypothetical protein TKK_0015366 [Trichogramma kaykai]